MSSTTWTSTGSTNWYTGGNWSGGVPTVSTSGTELVVVSGADGTQPIISPLAVGAPGTFTVDVNGFVIKETQLDGQFITLTTGADLTLQGLALGNYRGTSGDTAPGGTISNLTDVNGTLASYDTHMLISATGSDKLVSNDINENFGQILAGAGDTLSISVTPGGNPQSIQAFLNYGLIEATSGGVITVGTAVAANGTTSVFANPGWIEAIGGTFDTTAFISDNANVPNGAGTPDGYIEIGSGGTAILNGTVAPKEEVLFLDGTSDSLDLNDYTGFSGSVANFGSGDSIVLGGFTPIAGDELVAYYDSIAGTLHVNEYNPQTQTGDENFVAAITGPSPGSLTTPNFSFSFSSAGLVISDNPCFAAGTRILTPTGEVAVENLAVGDEVLTAREGFESIAAIIWTGQRTIDLARHAMPEKVRPVRILAGAFGPGLPERDLILSPDHALFIDGHLIEAKTLVNGVTVIADKDIRHITYHHIELAKHDVVLAEGLPAETYLESGNRTMFESDAAPMVLHPDFVTLRRERACARLAVSGPVVTAARQRLLDRALALGFAVTGDVDLVVKAGLERIRPSEAADGELFFVLPAGVRQVQLLSGTGVPAEISADPGDRRVLGVAVAGLALIAGGERHSIKLDDAAHEGFHDMEAGHRWTKGAARIALPPYSGRAVLEVAIHGQAVRWSSVASRQLSG
jgi:hypothetical protein